MEFTFKLNEQDTQKVLNALAKEPLGYVIEVFNKLQSQASEQMPPQEQVANNPFYAKEQEGTGKGI